MRALSADQLLDKTMEGLPEGHNFQICTDNVFIPDDYLDRIREGNINQVPSIWGSTMFESAFMFVTAFENTPMNRGLEADETAELLDLFSGVYNNPEPVKEELIAFYLPDGTGDVWRNLGGVTRMISDAMFESPKAFKLDSLAGLGGGRV